MTFLILGFAGAVGVLLIAVIGWLVVLGMLDSWRMWKQMKQ